MTGPRNLSFAAWMLLFLPLNSAAGYFDYLANGGVVEHYSDGVKGLAALLVAAVWVVVGALLYEGKSK